MPPSYFPRWTQPKIGTTKDNRRRRIHHITVVYQVLEMLDTIVKEKQIKDLILNSRKTEELIITKKL